MVRRILIQREVWDNINDFSLAIQGKYETGGIFLGYRRREDIQIIQATFPGAKDKSSKYAFHRLSPHHQIAATTGWANSEGTLDWVGEWHTHPEDDPSPSSVDTNSWRQIAKRSNKSMFYSIHGHSGQWTGVLEWPSNSLFRKIIVYTEKSNLLLR